MPSEDSGLQGSEKSSGWVFPKIFGTFAEGLKSAVSGQRPVSVWSVVSKRMQTQRRWLALGGVWNAFDRSERSEGTSFLGFAYPNARG